MSKKAQTVILTILVLVLLALVAWLNSALDRIAQKSHRQSRGESAESR